MSLWILGPYSCTALTVLKDAVYSKSLSSRLLVIVYKGIAPGEDRKALPSLDINTKRLADGLLQLSFSLSEQVSNTCEEALPLTMNFDPSGLV